MRPMRLHMQGFGAFAEKAEIDLTGLDGSTLLLIHGPTGAGKTTIFDAICFALYGISSGARTPDQMRSDHCAQGTSTRVMYEFSLPSGRYRITREFKPRRRTDSVEPKAVLEFFDRAGVQVRPPLVKRSEIRSAVEHLLGLDEKQFRQIVMLPQNEFQKLLLADTKSKQAILERLFRASLYSRISDILSSMTQEKNASCKDLKSRIAGFLESHGVEDATALSARQKEAEESLHAASVGLPDLRLAWGQAQTACDEARRVVEHHNDLRKAQEEMQRHLGRQDQIEELRGTYVAALRAEPFRPRLEEIEEREEAMVMRGKAIAKLQTDVAETRGRQEVARHEADRAAERNGEVLRLQIEMHRLDAARPHLIRLEEDRKALTRLDEDSRQLVEKLRECAEQKNASTLELSQIDSDIPALEATALTCSGLEASVRRTRELQQPFRELQELRLNQVALQTDVAGAEDLLDRATRASRAAEDALRSVEARWVEGQSSRLSAALVQGQPCPVCGSVDHPRPAHAVTSVVTDVELASARTARERMDGERETAMTRFHAARNALAQNAAALMSHETILGSFVDTDKATFAHQLGQQESELQRAQKAAGSLTLLHRTRGEVTDRLQKLQRDIDAFQERKNACAQERTTVAVRIENALKMIGDDVTDLATLNRKQSDVSTRITALTRQNEEAQNSFTALAGEVIRLQAGLDGELKVLGEERAFIMRRRADLAESFAKVGFSSVEEIRTALLPEGERHRLNGLVQEWDEQLLALRNTVDERKRVVGGRAEPDLAPLLLAEERGRKAFEDAQQRATEAQTIVSRLAGAGQQLQTLANQLEVLRSEAGTMQELSDAVAGRNDMGITLSSYVLSVFLDEIVTFANTRLRVISHDRYALIRRTESDDRRRRVGLDLDVFDNYTGEQRQVQTLSGGEQFYAALSLALGVADAAQQHTGGVRMDALFIDEGFGSLDNETLDVAIGALMDLQADGRLVAIISHVEELKTRVPVRLEVVKGRTGSSVRWSSN